VTFIIAAIVVPEGDCSIAMTRDCFESDAAFLLFELPAADRAEFAVDTCAADVAAAGCFADFDIEILRSVDGGVAPHHQSPITAMGPAGQDL
jgi:hypothetical protein